MAEGSSGASTSTARAEAAEQIRGSTLLMSGRVIEVLANMVVQVMVVRSLSQSDYGAFAYAFAFTATAKVVVTLGHSRTITRFFAIYDEERRFDLLLGTIYMEFAIIAGMGVVGVLGAWWAQSVLVGTLVPDALSGRILVIFMLLAPVEALAGVMEGLLAVFARPRSVFIRRYVLSPALKLSVIGVLVARGDGVVAIAAAYVLVSVVGLAFYAPMLVGVMRRRGILERRYVRGARVPVREVFSFSVPLLSTELVQISMNTVSVVILGAYGGTTAVGAFRAVRPAAMLNSFVLRSFNLLFMPMASRLYSRGDVAGMQDAYWRTATWIAVLTFPMFAMSFVFAEQMTVTLFGERYRESADLLSVLAVGVYCNAALGFNSTMLQIAGRLRYLVVVNVAAAAANVVLCLALIPSYGAMGLVVAAAVALVLQNALNQAGLRGVGIAVAPRAHVRVYAWIIGMAAVLWVVERATDPGIILSIALTGAVSAVVLAVNHDMLEVGDIYPALARIPVLRRLVAAPPAEASERRGGGAEDAR